MFKKGKFKGHDEFTLITTKAYLPYERVGLSISTKLGNAVTRNKVKRRIRVVFTELQKSGVVQNTNNYIIIAKPGAEKLKLEDIRKKLQILFSGVSA